MSKVFLGGTTNNSTWRQRLIAQLEHDYFNPVVDDWNEEAIQRELKERAKCDFCLCVITPLMTGAYSIAEVVDDSNKRPDKTILVLLQDDDELSFDIPRWKSLLAVSKMVEGNGGKVFYNLEDVAAWLNSQEETNDD